MGKVILHIDLNAKPFQKVEDLYDLLNDQLTIYEKMYDSVAVDKSPEGRLRQLIRAAKQKTGRNVVVLVDEYDKPILQAIGNEELQTEFRNALKAFYGVLKSADGDLRFAMLTEGAFLPDFCRVNFLSATASRPLLRPPHRA